MDALIRATTTTAARTEANATSITPIAPAPRSSIAGQVRELSLLALERTVDYLEVADGVSGKVLDGIASFGDWYAGLQNGVSRLSERAAAVGDEMIVIGGAIDGTRKAAHQLEVADFARNHAMDVEIASKHWHGSYSDGNGLGGIMKHIGHVASVLDAITGVGETAKVFAEERRAGDSSYAGTMKAVASSTGRIAAGAAAAGLVAGAIASAPVAVTIGIGAAAAYGAGKLFSWLGN